MIDEKKVADLRARLASAPQDDKLWYALAMELTEDDWPETVKCLSRALNLNPFCAEYYFIRGRKKLALHKYPEASADLTHATRIDAHDGMKWHYLGVAYFYMEEFARAVRYFQRAIIAYRARGIHLVWPSVDWMFMSHMRMGDEAAAMAALDLVGDDEAVEPEDAVYKKRVRLYKGLVSAGDFEAQINRASTLDVITESYALVNYYRYLALEEDKAEALVEKILAIPVWHQAFGYRSSEVDREKYDQKRRDGI